MYSIVLLTLLGLSYGKLVVEDLTYSFDNTTTIYWPGGKRFESIATGSGDYEANEFCTAEHGGTHMDSPRHFVPGTQGVHEIPLNVFVSKNPFVVDVSDDASKDSDLLITKQHIENAENKNGNGALEEGGMVLLYTGWSTKWDNSSAYFGGDPNNSSTFHFPGLSNDAAIWLSTVKKIGSIGIDTASIDFGQSKTFLSHKHLFKYNIPAFENVNLLNIRKLREKKDLMVVALPMKIKDGSGAPLRIIASYGDSDCSNKGIATRMDPYVMIITLIVAVLFVQYRQ